MKRNERQKEAGLRSNLKQLVQEEAKKPGKFIEGIRNTKRAPEALDVDKFKGATVRADAQKMLAGEQPTKRALADEKRFARKRDIVEIEREGIVTQYKDEIALAFTEYYRDLFAMRNPKDRGFETEFLHCLPQLESEETEILDRDIMLYEIEEVINELNRGKSPGPGGIGAAFYKKF